MAGKGKVFRNVLLVFLGLVILLLVFLPVLARNYVIKNSKELIGRQVDIDKVRINYFTSTLKVFDLKMYEADDEKVFFSFDTLIINTEPYRYISNIISLDQFYLQGLDVNIVKQDSTFNFDDLVAFHSAPDTTSADTTEEEEIFKYMLSNLEMKDGAFHFYNADVNDTTTIEDLDLLLPYIEWDQENDSDADFELSFAEGGKLRSDFSYHPKTKDFEAKITIEDLKLSPFYRYAVQYAEINALEGTINTMLDFKGNSDNPEQTLISGNLELLDFLMTDRSDTKFLGSDLVSCKLNEINTSEDSYKIGELSIDNPYIKFELDSVSNNIFRIFKLESDREGQPADSISNEELAADSDQEVETEDTTTVKESPGGSDLYYAVEKFKVNKGVLDYTDNLTGEPFEYHLSDILIDTDSIYSDSEWIDLLAEMLLNERGTLEAELGFNPQDMKNLKLDIAVEEFVLSDLNIYANHYTGHSILRGDMFYFSDSEVTKGKIESENNLLIKDVSVENTESGIMSIPLKLAVFILKDKNGDIELNVPVRGDLNNPTVDVWDLVWTTLKKRIFDATENPAPSLARLVDAEAKDLETVMLNYPDTLLTGEMKRQLDLMLELEEKKEGLSIQMNYLFDADAVAEIADSLNAGGNDPLSDASIRDSLVNKLNDEQYIATSRVLDSAGQGMNVSGKEELVSDSLLTQYGEIMAASIERYLVEKNSATGIEVKKAEVSEKDRVDALPQFKVKYGLKETADTQKKSEEEPDPDQQ